MKFKRGDLVKVRKDSWVCAAQNNPMHFYESWIDEHGGSHMCQPDTFMIAEVITILGNNVRIWIPELNVSAQFWEGEFELFNK